VTKGGNDPEICFLQNYSKKISQSQQTCKNFFPHMGILLRKQEQMTFGGITGSEKYHTSELLKKSMKKPMKRT